MNLDNFPQPDSNDSGTVEAALQALWNARDELSATDACDAFLWAVGNNHAGTFYPVVLGTLAEVKKILVSGKPWAQRAVMEALIDLGGTFVPEAGHVTFPGEAVQGVLNGFIQSLRADLAPLAEGQDVCAASARELLELVDDRAA